jgi:RNA polymerase sigma factor (sigma-70 family)
LGVEDEKLDGWVLSPNRRRRPFMDQSDTVAALVQAARRGDQSAWDDLVERFLPLVTALIGRHRLSRADADDVNQTVWLRLVEHLDDIREPRAVPGWIATTTRNECLRVLQRGRRTMLVDPLVPSQLDRHPDDALVDDDLLREEREQALRDALQELPKSRRELLVLLLADPPVPYSEISRRLGIAVGSIGPTRARAIDQLRTSTALSAFLADCATEPRR